MRKLKAGKRGLVTKYITRSKAIRKLQLSLKDFRRLCILKGIYPREPPQKLKKLNKTYYHTKDINFLSADTLIDRFRQQKIWLRKYKHARAKGMIGQVRFMKNRRPKYNLTHLIRERYPEFTDALRDLDDPLSLIALFSIFPSHKEFHLSRDRILRCTELLRHFNLYVIQTHALKKAFLSIKGIYYQCEIMGQKVTCLCPYEYPPNLPQDVDYRVMSTFLEFYDVLLNFVMFKLYNMIGKKYPSKLQSSEE
jgi:pescadillo protein